MNPLFPQLPNHISSCNECISPHCFAVQKRSLPGERQPLFPHQASLTQALSRRPQTGNALPAARTPQNTAISLKGSPSTAVHNGAAETYRTYKATAGNDRPTGNDHYRASSCLQVLEQKMAVIFFPFLPTTWLSRLGIQCRPKLTRD